MNVPFLDLKAINARHAAELKAAAARVIDSGWYVLGEEVKAFEAEFAAWTGSPHGVGPSDGLSALILALRGWKELGLLKDGDGVAVPANTYIASILAITVGHQITRASGDMAKVSAFTLFSLLSLLPAIVPLLLALFRPEAGPAIKQKCSDFLEKNGRWMAALICFVFAIVLWKDALTALPR